MVGRNTLDAAAGHRHRRICLEAGHAQERNQGTGDILADTAAVSIVHLSIVQGIPLALAHGNARIPDVVGHPVGQHGYLLHFSLLSAYQLIHLLLGGRIRFKAAVVLIDLIEPQRFVPPLRSSRQHKFRCRIEKIHHIRLAIERHHVIHRKLIDLAAVLKPHRRCALTLIELELHVLLHRKRHHVDLAHGRIRTPERHDVVELPPHRRNEPRVLLTACRNCSAACTVRCQQGVCKSFLGYLIFHNITRSQSTDLHHNLTGAPVNHPCRSGIIKSSGHIQMLDTSVSAIHCHILELGKRCKRIIVIPDGPVGQCPLPGLHLERPAHSESPLTRGLHADRSAVQQDHTVSILTGQVRSCGLILPPGLGRQGRRDEKYAG